MSVIEILQTEQEVIILDDLCVFLLINPADILVHNEMERIRKVVSKRSSVGASPF